MVGYAFGTVTAEAAGSSPVSPAILLSQLGVKPASLPIPGVRIRPRAALTSEAGKGSGLPVEAT